MSSNLEKLTKPWMNPYLRALIEDSFLKASRSRLAPLEVVALEADGRSVGVDLADLLSRERSLLLIGDSGSGKTTLLRSIAHDYASYALNFGKGDVSQYVLCEELAIPVYLDALEAVSDSLENILARWCGRYIAGNQVNSMLSFLETGVGVLFLIDNLDCLFLDKRFAEFQNVIRFMTERYPQHQFVLAVGSQHVPALRVVLPPQKIACIQPLTQETILRYLSTRFSESEVDRIAQNLTSLKLWPVVNNTRSLDSAAWLILDEEWQAEPTRTRFFGKLLPLIVGGDVLNQWSVLSELALTMAKEGVFEIEKARISRFVREREQESSSRRDPLDMFIASGLISINPDGGKCSFNLPIYRDYLAAVAVQSAYRKGAKFSDLMPNDLAPWADIISLYYGMTEDRRGMLRELLTSNSDINRVRVAVKCALENERRSDLRQALQVSFFDPNLHFLIGKALKELGCYEEACLELEESTKLKPDRADIRFELAETFAAMGKTRQSQKEYKMALDMSPKEIAWQVRVALSSSTGKDEIKIRNELFTLAAELAAQQAEIYMHLSKLAWQRFDEAESIRLARIAVTLSPSAQTATYLGDVLGKFGHRMEAKNSYSAAIEKDGVYAPAHVGLGLLLEEEGFFSDALAHFRRALELSPEKPENHLNVGRLYRLAGEFLLAELHLRRSLRLSNRLASAQSELALLFESQSKSAEAIDSIRGAIDNDPRNPLYHHLHGRFLRSVGKLQDAENEIRQALAIQDDNPEWHNELGTVLTEMGRFPLALEEYERASVLAPSNPLYRRNIGVALVQLGEDELALTAFRDALKLSREPREGEKEGGASLLWTLVAADANSEIGQIFERRSDHHSALEYYSRARELMPDLPSYRIQEGMAYGRFNQHDRMLKVLQKAVQMDPDDAIAHSQLGEAYEALGQIDEALGEYAKAEQLQPNEASFARNKGRVLHHLGRNIDSIESLRKATELQHQDFDAHLHLALAYEASGRLEEAASEGRHAARLDVNNYVGWLTLGRCTRKLRRAGESLTALKRAVSLNPTDGKVHIEIAECYLQQAKFKDALKAAEDAIVYGQNEAYYYYLASLAKDGLGDVEGALSYMEKATTLDPDNADWQFELAKTLASAGKTDLALEGFEKTLALSPSTARYHREFAGYLRQIGLEERAFSELQAAVKSEPGDAEMRYDLAFHLMERGEQDQALHHVLAALEEGPIKPKHHWLAGTILVKLGRSGSAMAHLEKAVSLDPEQPEWHRQLGWIYLKTNQVPFAVQSFNRSLSLKDTPQVHRDLAQAYFKAGQMKEAANRLRTALRHPAAVTGEVSDQERGQWYNELGDICRESRNWEGSLDAYQTAVDLLGESGEIRKRIGFVLTQQGRHLEAIAELEKAVENGDASGDLFYSLGKSLLSTGNLEAAFHHANRAVQIEPTVSDHHLLIATILKRQGEYSSAVRYAARALQIKPDDPAIYDELGTLYEKVGQAEMAVSAYQKALEMDHKNVGFKLHLSRLLLSRRNALDVLPHLASAVDSSPDSAEALFLFGWALEEQGKTSDAIVAYRRAISLDNKNAECIYRLGRLLGQSGDVQNAISLLEEANKLDSTHVNWHADLAGMFESIGNISRALEEFQVAGELDPGSADVSFRHGSLLLKKGRIKDATVLLEKACRMESVPAIWLNELGKAYLSEKRAQEARDCFEKAINLSPAEDAYRVNLAASFREMGMVSDSISRLKSITKARPNLAEAYFQLGLSQRAQRSHNDTLGSLQTALRLAPENHDFRLSLAETLLTLSRESEAILQVKNIYESGGSADVLYRSGKLAESIGQNELALSCFERALKSDRNADCLSGCSRLYAKLGKIDQAINLLTEAVSQDDSSAAMFTVLGEMLEEKGEIQEAVARYKRAVEINPDEPIYHRNLGVAYEMLGKYDLAKESLQIALKLKSDYTDAFRHLSSVSAKQTLERGIRKADHSH